MRCPGQDMQFWKDDAVFEVPCPKCGAAVEFFKDESSGRCTSCGHRFKNPKLDLECAKWCSFAEKCLGYAPQSDPELNLGEGALARVLIQAVKEEFNNDQARLAHALVVFQHAKELVRKEGGDPRVVLAAALLLEVAFPPDSSPGEQNDRGLAKVRGILQEIGLEEDVAKRACQIVSSRRMDSAPESTEFRIVSDAHELAKLASENPDASLDTVEKIIENDLLTTAGKQRARSLFQA